MSRPPVRVRILPQGSTPLTSSPFEFVERKGCGHPDTLCDAFAEALAVAIAHRYRSEIGGLLHFNVDKMLLSAGQVERDFGGGHIVRPMTLYVGDRVTTHHDGRDLGIIGLVHETADRFFARVLPHLDRAAGLRIVPVFGAGSCELSDVIRAPASIANDTSAAVGFAPATPLERATLQLEQWLNGRAFKRQFPATGEDVKIMAVRHERAVDFTVAMPFLAHAIASAATYRELHAAVTEAARSRVRELLAGAFDVTLSLNALDDHTQGSRGLYLTLSGTSAEHGDSGEVGRGNRANGLITFMRPSGMEAVAGKNPIAHVGKIYSVLACVLAQQVLQDIPGIEHVTVWLASRIGAPIDQPRCVDVELVVEPETAACDFEQAVAAVIEDRLRKLPELCDELERGVRMTC